MTCLGGWFGVVLGFGFRYWAGVGCTWVGLLFDWNLELRL